MKKIRWVLLILICSVIAGPSLFDTLIEKLTQPAGEVCVEGDECEQSANVVASTSDTGARSVEEIYAQGCMSCHDAGIAGAPQIGVKSAWQPRLSGGFAGLVNNAYNGYGAMPAKGLCFDCSEAEIEEAVRYMLAESGITL